MSFAFFFPGQGSQSLNMMSGFDQISCVKDTFVEASDVLGQDLWAMINGTDEAVINSTVNTQPLMLTAGIATYRAYLEAQGKPPSVVAGHSLGEYSALVAAQSLSFEDAIKLVRVRAQLMQEAVPEGIGAMAAILGLDDEAVKAVCVNSAQGEIVEAVNFNAKGQVVIAGNASAVERAMLAAKEAGAKRALPLPVSVPSHCALMKGAAEKLAHALDSITVNKPTICVLHNVDVQSYSDSAAIKDALVRQLYSPVLWTQTVASLADEGVHLSAECGPGKVLAGLTKRITDKMNCQPLVKMDDVHQFISTLQ
ncbi:ACP S-malonyltransferase [Neisseria sp. Ec49-e6-T10]|uniref:ACP S-malonyltransferase n=1 Tax=Neisseria sp. Ec49-e6-T10 TaxID=3140744 RepID=UPI003EB79080